MSNIGIIAGAGRLPLYVAEEALRTGSVPYIIALEPVADADFKKEIKPPAKIESVSVGKLDKIIKTLKKNRVREAVMAGKVPKALLYKSRVLPDFRAARLVLTLKDRKDDTILLAVAHELEKDGIKLLPITRFCSGLLAPEGEIAGRKPDRDELKDIAFGRENAREMGRLDIGQTVVVKDRAVMAVEAIEGTDEAIRRGGMLAGKGAVVVKLSKPGQDLRFDVPVAGLSTIEAMIESRASVLALEASQVLLVEKEAVIKKASSAGIKVIGFKGD
jgi:DUF1009 family protein